MNQLLRITSVITFAALSSFASLALAKDFKTQTVTISAETIASGLDHPWGLAFLPDGALLVTERGGKIRIVRDGKVSRPVADVPKVAVRGEGGLLDVALAPDFAKSGTIYFSYTQPRQDGVGTVMASARLARDADGAELENVKVLLSVKQSTRGWSHFGSRILVAPNGKIFVTIGDQGTMKRSQDFKDEAGSILRIDADGSAPSDNPFADGGQALAEIWSKGHRNPQGLVWDAVTDSPLIVDHGAKGGDEINQPQPGKNYGWPVITYGVDYSGEKIGVGTHAEGYEQPLHYWDPSIAPSGLAVYDGAMFPEWKGDLLLGALKARMLVRMDRDDKGAIKSEERMLKGAFGRIRDVRVANDGSIYLLTDEGEGKIIRLTRAG